MSTAQIRRRMKETIDSLPPERLHVAADFLEYLRDRSSANAATRELLAIPGFLQEFRQGLKEVRSGRTTPIEKLRRKS